MIMYVALTGALFLGAIIGYNLKIRTAPDKKANPYAEWDLPAEMLAELYTVEQLRTMDAAIWHARNNLGWAGAEREKCLLKRLRQAMAIAKMRAAATETDV